ncbi:ArdC family protein [Acidovorax soli]|uniref:ArdC family protein n=1 Tax=Acidovorax soli TaxID=592050 RepID=UPI0032B1DE9F
MAAENTTKGQDLYAQVTQQIIAALEAGTRPWTRPWTAIDGPAIAKPIRSTGEPYRGINVLLLWSAALERGFSSNRWFTFKQARAAGTHVRKGEQGAMVVYAGRFEPKDDAENSAEDSSRRPGAMYLHAYTVFNAEQLDSLAVDVGAPASASEQGLSDGVQSYFERIGVTVVHSGDRACYVPGADMVKLSPPAVFKDADAYCATLAHELIHWTGHPTRLAREFGQRFGDSAYAFEELVAELGAAFVCADLGIATDAREDHAAYLQSWLHVLRTDKRAIFTAATQAQQAADYLSQRCGVACG